MINLHTSYVNKFLHERKLGRFFCSCVFNSLRHLAVPAHYAQLSKKISSRYDILSARLSNEKSGYAAVRVAKFRTID